MQKRVSSGWLLLLWVISLTDSEFLQSGPKLEILRRSRERRKAGIPVSRNLETRYVAVVRFDCLRIPYTIIRVYEAAFARI